MQTFLPLPDFNESALVLDRMRLGKQRVETLQIINVILKKQSGEKVAGWANHPAVRMWERHVDCLGVYGLAICEEWTRRGYRDTVHEKIIKALNWNPYVRSDSPSLQMVVANGPEWLGDDRLHSSHRSRLIQKMPEHYGMIWPDERNDLEYWWPV